MTQLQPSRIKNRSSKVWKKFKTKDVVEFTIILITSFFIAYALSKLINVKFIFFAFWVPTFLLGLILILPNRKNNCKIYVLIWRMFAFWTQPKHYKKENSKNIRASIDLNPYSCLINEFTVKNKNAKISFYDPKNDKENYLSVFKLNGINIWNEDQITQEAFIDAFAKTLNTIAYKISFVKLEEKVNYDENIKYIKSKENKLHNDSLWKNYYELNIQDFFKQNNEALQNNYYLIVNGDSLSNLNESLEIITDKFNDTGISLEKLENVKLLTFLSNLNLFEIDKKTIDTYCENIEAKYGKENSLDDLFIYEETIIKQDHLIINNNLVRISCLNSLPFELNEKWVKTLFSIQGTCVWNNFPLSEDFANKKLDKSILASIDTTNATGSPVSNMVGSIDEQATTHMALQVNRDEYKLFDSNFFFVIKDKNIAELNSKYRIAKNIANKKNITLNDLRYRQLLAWSEVCNYPFERLDKEYYQITSINLALGWPFESENHNDNNNLLLGFTDNTRMPISFKLFDMSHSNRTNFNMFVNGTSGMGKTTFTKKLLTSILSANNKVVIIDPQGEYTELATKLNGQIIDLGIGKNTIINPLQVRNTLKDSTKNDVISLINNHLSWLESFFKTLLNIEPHKWILLQNVIKDFYKDNKIYKLNDIECLEASKWPTMSDLINYISKYKTDHLNNSIIKKAILDDLGENLTFLFENNGRYQELFNGYTNISLDNDFVVFNTQNLINGADNIGAKLGTMCLLNFVSEIVFNNWTHNEILKREYLAKNNIRLMNAKQIEETIKFCAVIVDEAHLYVDPDNPSILKYMVQMTKTVRKFNAGMIFTTQNPGDFTVTSSTTEDASRIIQNSQYSVFFGLKDSDIEKVQTLFKNSNQLLNSEIRYLTNHKKGKCLFSISSNKRMRLNIYYNQLEKEMFFSYIE